MRRLGRRELLHNPSERPRDRRTRQEVAQLCEAAPSRELFHPWCVVVPGPAKPLDLCQGCPSRHGKPCHADDRTADAKASMHDSQHRSKPQQRRVL